MHLVTNPALIETSRLLQMIGMGFYPVLFLYHMFSIDSSTFMLVGSLPLVYCLPSQREAIDGNIAQNTAVHSLTGGQAICSTVAD
jgi:hypothetical protein